MRLGGVRSESKCHWLRALVHKGVSWDQMDLLNRQSTGAGPNGQGQHDIRAGRGEQRALGGPGPNSILAFEAFNHPGDNRLAPQDDTFLKILSNIEEVKARGGIIITVTDEENDPTSFVNC